MLMALQKQAVNMMYAGYVLQDMRRIKTNLATQEDSCGFQVYIDDPTFRQIELQMVLLSIEKFATFLFRR